MTRIDFQVSGEPVGQPRARHAGRVTRAGKVITKVYNPTTIKRKDGTRYEHPIVAWRKAIAGVASLRRPPRVWLGPVALSIEAYFERPQYLNKPSSHDGPIWHTAKPDRDNLEKAVMDVLRECGFYRDDAQVCGGTGTQKFYCGKGYDPGIIVSVELLDPAGEDARHDQASVDAKASAKRASRKARVSLEEARQLYDVIG